MGQPKASLTCTLRPSDCAELVGQSLINLFPEQELPSTVANEFPKSSTVVWEFNEIDLTKFLELLTKQRILDTALDAMTFNLHDDSTFFNLSRQAALASKVGFVLDGESALGGTFEITLEGDGLGDWIEQATWHEGRIEVPRQVGDEHRMKYDGNVRDWFP